MISIKVKFRPSLHEQAEGTICYQLSYHRRVYPLCTNYKVYRSEWDSKRSRLVPAQTGGRRAKLLALEERLHLDVAQLHRIAKRLLLSAKSFTVEDIAEGFRRYQRDYSLFYFMEQLIAQFKERGQVRTAETYRATLCSFKAFRAGEDLLLDSLSAELMEAYEAWLRARGLVPNTISFYMRILRAVYNRALEAEVIEDRKPFRRVYTGVAKTVKRALPLPLLKQLKALDLSAQPALDFARDMFLLSFYLRGMSFIDMMYLRKSDLSGGYISYRRRKTQKTMVIAWTKEMQLILDKYPENPTGYLLPILVDPNVSERSVYGRVGYNINYNLKKIGLLLGIRQPLTLYVARHSWATAAQAMGIPLRVISEGMGHDSEETTQIYLASLDTTAVDQANALILNQLQ